MLGAFFDPFEFRGKFIGTGVKTICILCQLILFLCKKISASEITLQEVPVLLCIGIYADWIDFYGIRERIASNRFLEGTSW